MTALHPQARAALALWAAGPAVRTLDPEGIRRQRAEGRAEGLAEVKEPVGRVEDVDAAGVPCRLLRPAEAAHGHSAPGPGQRDGTALPCLLDLHGGGFVFGDLETHDAHSRRLANRTGRAVLAVDYRRPPEHVFPAALVDSVAALDWLLAHGASHGLDTARVALTGDSAGGNLAIGVALRRPGLLEAAVLTYPFLDPGTGSPSYASTAGGLDREDAQWYWQQYVEPGSGLEVWGDPELAPLRSDGLGGLPPTLVQVAEADTLADENRALVRRARDQGAEVSEVTYPGMVHGFWRHPGLFDAATEALADLARFLARPG